MAKRPVFLLLFDKLFVPLSRSVVVRDLWLELDHCRLVLCLRFFDQVDQFYHLGGWMGLLVTKVLFAVVIIVAIVLVADLLLVRVVRNGNFPGLLLLQHH